MARQYSPKTFLRQVPNTLLNKYFKQTGIGADIDWDALGETETDPIFAALEALPPATLSRVESDFRAINELATERGTLAILEEASLWGLDWSEPFAEMRNPYERAFWTFLNEPGRFEAAGAFHQMDRLGGWRRRYVGEGLKAATDEASLEDLAEHLRQFYAKQGRGRHCHVDHYERLDPGRHCYFAYPEDYASTDIGFDEAGRLTHRPRKPVFENIFVYRPEEGILEVCARGTKDQVESLMEIFCVAILGLDGLPEEAERAHYDLSVLKDRNFAYTTEPEDGVQAVHIRQMRLDLPGYGRRITLSADSSWRWPKALHDLIDEAIDKKNVSLDDAEVSQAKLWFTFAPSNGRRPKTLTFEVATPDRCTLKDDPYDQIAKKYLRQWGIAHDRDAAVRAAAG